MKVFVYSALLAILLQSLLATAANSLQCREANLTNWRQHRRQKRFILFEDAGICKLVCGITYPVDLSDKKPWRQLVMTMNLQYQFPVPPKPYYWSLYWDERRNLPPYVKAPTTKSSSTPPSSSEEMDNTDHSQLFLYQFAEDLMERREMNGRSCMQRAICENAQIHQHNGVFAEILHRVLIPHSSAKIDYQDAYRMGQHGINCRQAFPSAHKCLLDQFLSVREENFKQSFLKK